MEEDFAADADAGIAAAWIGIQAEEGGGRIGVAGDAQGIGGGAEVIHDGHGGAVGVEVEGALGLAEVDQPDGFVGIGAVDSAAVLVVDGAGGARGKHNRGGSPSVGAGDGVQENGFHGGGAPFQRQGAAIDEKCSRPGIGRAGAHAGVGVDEEGDGDGLGNAGFGGEEAEFNGPGVGGGVGRAVGRDGQEVRGGDGGGQAEENAVGALGIGRDGLDPAYGPVGGVFHRNRGDGFVEGDIDVGGADGAGGGADPGRIDIAGQHVGDAVGVGVEGDVKIGGRGDNAVGIVLNGLAGDGVGRTPGGGVVVGVETGEEPERRAAGHGFAGFDGAPAGAFVEDGPGDAGFESLVGAGGGAVVAGHVHGGAGGNAAVAGVEDRFGVVGGGGFRAVVQHADGVVVEAFAGEHDIQAERSAVHPSVSVPAQVGLFVAGPVGGRGGAGARAGVGIEQHHELLAVLVPALERDVEIGVVPRDKEVGQGAVGPPGGDAGKGAAKIAGVIFQRLAVKGGRVGRSGPSGGRQQNTGEESQDLFHNRLHA